MISDLKKKKNKNIAVERDDDPHIALSSSERISDLNRRGEIIFRRVEILKSLYFTGMRFRYSKVETAHEKIFQWCYELKFRYWLTDDSPIFWISGKPGSGKSTLMKYLVENPMTRTHLETWAEPHDLSILSYFFWVNGNDLQRSQEGLLRSIIFDLLRQFPDLIDESILPKASYDFPSDPIYDIRIPDSYAWTSDALQQTFKRIIGKLKGTNKYCIFIDGLDEYQGDDTNLIDFIKSLQQFPALKLCVASRPWTVFESEFGCDISKNIYMQELTHGDIQCYVREKLETQPQYQKLVLDDESSSAQGIIEELVSKAQGVFLWVRLVVRSLIHGLQNVDRIIDLKRRLKAFPSDLNDYFGYILKSLDPIYRVQTAKGFQAALAAEYPLSVMQFWYLDMEEDDADYAIAMQALDHRESTTFRRRERRRVDLIQSASTLDSKGCLRLLKRTEGLFTWRLLMERRSKHEPQKLLTFSIVPSRTSS